MNTPNPFPDRKLVSLLLRIFGWPLAFGGIGYAVEAILKAIAQKHGVVAVDVLGGLVAAVAGIWSLAGAGLIDVAFVIEANTRRMADGMASQQAKQP